jgi:hypothetical protein
LGGVFAENTSLETKFTSPFGSENFSSLDWYFSQIPLPNMTLYNYILLVMVICEKYRLRGEANIPSRFSGEGHLTVLETGIFRK